MAEYAAVQEAVREASKRNLALKKAIAERISAVKTENDDGKAAAARRTSYKKKK